MKWWGILFCLVSSTASATLTVLSTSVGNTQIISNQLTLYAGCADASVAGCSGSDILKTYNSCSDLTDVTATGGYCNEKNFFPSLVVVFNVKLVTTETIPATAKFIATTSTGSTTVTINEDYTTQPPIRAGDAQIAINWLNICNGIEADSACKSNFTGSIKIGLSKDDGSTMSADVATVNIKYRTPADAPSGFDPSAVHTACSSSQGASDYEGACGFNVKPGDEKVYIEPVVNLSGATATKWPNIGDGSGMNYTGIRVFYVPYSGTTCKWTDSNLSFSLASGDVYRNDVTIDSEGNVGSNRKIDGLNNEQCYFFVIGTIDQAGNVSGFSGIDYLKTEYAVNHANLHHTAIPGDVVGLLDGKKCFIATAAYGSEMDSRVDLIRQFRNRFLLPHGWGRSFIRWYYKKSPPVAEFIARHESLRTVVRWTLWPVVGVSELALKIGLMPAMTMILIGLWVALRVFRLRIRRSR